MQFLSLVPHTVCWQRPLYYCTNNITFDLTSCWLVQHLVCLCNQPLIVLPGQLYLAHFSHLSSSCCFWHSHIILDKFKHQAEIKEPNNGTCLLFLFYQDYSVDWFINGIRQAQSQHYGEFFRTVKNRGACKRSQRYFLKMGPGPTREPGSVFNLGACSIIHLSPSDCLCIYIESIQLVRCVCEVRVIQTLQQFYCFDKRHHFTEKRRETKETQAALRSSVKLEREKYTKQMFVTLHNDNTIERLSEQQGNRTYRIHTYAKIKERKLRFHNLTSFFSVPCWWWITLLSGQPHSSGHQIPLVGHSGGVWPISYSGTCIYSMCMCTVCVKVYCLQ